MNEAADALAYWRHEHNQSARIPPRDEQPWRYDLAEYIAALTPTPRVVLELGCSSARNLAILHRYLGDGDGGGDGDDVELVGIEPNPTTADVARHAHGDWLELHEGDASLLEQFVDNAFDVVFTSSVLDHIPCSEWARVYDEMVRVARYHVVLLEPMATWKVLRDSKDYGRCKLASDEYARQVSRPLWIEVDCKDIGISAAPYSYLHDYCSHDPLLEIVRDLPVGAPSQWPQFPPLYKLAHRAK